MTKKLLQNMEFYETLKSSK